MARKLLGFSPELEQIIEQNEEESIRQTMSVKSNITESGGR